MQINNDTISPRAKSKISSLPKTLMATILIILLIGSSTLLFNKPNKEITPLAPIFVEADRALGETATDETIRSCMAKKAKEFFTNANSLNPSEINYAMVLDYIAKPEQQDTDWDRGVLTRGTIPYMLLVQCRAGLVSNSITIGDLDGDNLPEIGYHLTDGSYKFFWNESGGRFTPFMLPQLKRDCGSIPCFLLGTTFVDANGDGLQDVISIWPQGGALMTLYNLGDRRFESAPVLYQSDQKLIANDWSVSVTDLNKDGINDLIVSQRQFFSQIQNVIDQGANTRAFRIFYGTGKKENPWIERTLEALPKIQVLEGGFDKVSQAEQSGKIKYTEGPGATGTFSAVVADFNNDGWPDIYAASDYNIPRIYFAKKGGMEFYEYTIESGVLDGMQNTMGAAVVDWNLDGWLDIVATDVDEALGECASMRACKEIGGHRVLINNQDQTFTDIGRSEGISDAGWGFGFSLADLNLDGYRDFLVGTGDLSASRAESHWKAMFQEPVLLLGNGFKWFDNSTAINRPLSAISSMTVIAATDLDGDRKADLLFSGFENKTPFILLNRTVGYSTSLKIKTIGKGGTSSSLAGVKIKVEIKNRPDQIFLASGFTSNFLLSAQNVAFPIGLGDSKSAKVTVTFPTGKSVIRTLYAGISYEIDEKERK
jgi:hypothetical protein